MAKRKKRSNTPRRLHMNQQQRLQAAQQWIPTYTGQNIVQGYRNWFGTSVLCAALELKQLGVAVDDDYIARLRKSEDSTAAAHRKKREQRERAEWVNPDSDETFAYIAGYTSAGFPYGVTWEELGENPPWLEEA
jgi:hypothetical protein